MSRPASGASYHCACGMGCGLTFVRVGRQALATDCPNRAAIIKSRRLARDREETPPVFAPLHVNGRSRICKSCYNMSHARPADGCPGCGLPYAESTT